MHVLMGVVNLPSYTNYWSTKLRYPPIADVMPRKRFELIRRYLHVVDNNDYDELTDDKLFKIRPLIEAVRDECVKVEPEEYQSVDEQIIPSKTKFSKVRQYNPKKPKKWGFKIWFGLVTLVSCMISIYMLGKKTVKTKVHTITCRSVRRLLPDCVRICLQIQGISYFLTIGFQP